MQFPSGPPFFRSVAQSSERSAWDREAAGGNPAIPTNFKLLPWSNTRGICLLNGTMQVEFLPAAPLPGSVKVARRPVKPLVLVRVQVWQPFSGCNVSSRRPCSERGGRRCNSCHPDHFWKAGRYKLAAPVSKTGSAQTRGRSITDAFLHFGRVPTLNRNTQRKEILCDP